MGGAAAGVWLMAAPALLGYSGDAAGDLHRVLGPVVASLAVIAGWEATMAVRWPNAAIAAAVLAAPLVVSHTRAAIIVSVVTGVLLGAMTPFGGRPRRRLGGGWRSLVP